EDRRVTVESDAWRINALARPPGASPAILQLFDLPKQNVGRSVVILRFMMKTEKVERYATVHLSAGGETERLLGDSVRGTTDWKRYELRCECKAAIADVLVSVEIGGFGTMWLKDVVLLRELEPQVRIPPPNVDRPPAKEVSIKKFDPKVDKPFQIQLSDRLVTVEPGAWRVEAKKPAPPAPPGGWVAGPELRIFHLPRLPVQHA